MQNSKILPILAATLGNVFWGLSFLFITEALKYAPSALMLAHRFLIAVVVVGIYLLIRGKKITFKGKDWKSLVLMMILQVAYYFFETLSLRYCSTIIAGLVCATVPVVTIFTGAAFLKEIPTRRQALLCLLPVAGVILMTVYGNELGALKPLGILLLVLACLSSAFYRTAARKSAQYFDPWERTFLILATSTLFFCISGMNEVGWNIGEFLAPIANGQYVLAVLFLSLLCSVAANALVNYAVGKMEVMKLASFGAISTLCTMVAGVLILNEPVNLGLLIGAVLILVGIHRLTAK